MAQERRIVWLNVITVISAAILIGAEVFGAAFAGAWAIATLFSAASAHACSTWCLCSAASLSWRSSSAPRIASSRSPPATERGTLRTERKS